MAPGFSRVLRAWSSSSPDFGLSLHLREDTVVIVFGLRRRLHLRRRAGFPAVGVLQRLLQTVGGEGFRRFRGFLELLKIARALLSQTIGGL